MSVGSGVRICVKANIGLRMCNFLGGFRPRYTELCSDTSKYKYKLLMNSLVSSKNQTEKFHFDFPKLDVTIRKSIIEPEKSIKINFELPIRKSNVSELDLPFHIGKEIRDPVGVVISKKAVHMIRVRKRKMRKHKRKKYEKKHKVQIAHRRMLRKMQKEENFQGSIREILSEKTNFSAEKYLENTLNMVHWERPVNKVRGRLAPQWVIKQHLDMVKENKILRQRIKKCLK